MTHPHISRIVSMLLLSGCSLFTEFDYEAQQIDATVDTSMDARLDADAAIDADAMTDADADAQPPVMCNGAYADLVMDYADQSGASTFGRWTLLAHERDPSGVDYVPLVATANGFGALGVELIPCADGNCTAPLPVDSFEVRSEAGATGDATFALRVEADGVYTVSIPHQELDDASHAIALSRGHDKDVISAHGDLSDGMFMDRGYPSVSLRSDDRLLISVPPVTAGSVGVRVVVDCAPGDGSCILAADMDTRPLTTQCGTSSVVMDNPTAPGPGPSPEFGAALRLPFVTVAFPESTGLDLDGDFTIQFWLRVFETAADDAVIVGNMPMAADMGVSVELVGGVVSVRVPNGVASVTYGTFTPAPTAWHFYRIVRSAGVLTTCVDGVSAGSLDDPAVPTDLTSTEPVTTGSVPFAGAMDELRIFNEALPCVVD